jgi:hypothetical protein
MDIQMVYDASQCGLNAAVWVPAFGLPTINSTLQSIDLSTLLGDLDLGEMFLNFALDVKIRPYAGVNLSCFTSLSNTAPDITPPVRWELWGWCLMDFKPSPYNAI